MKSMTQDLLAGLLLPEQVSRGRLADAVSAMRPAAWAWCERPSVAVSRSDWCEALVAALPQTLLIGWRECLQRAGLPQPVRQARFWPAVEFFEDGSVGLTLGLCVHVELHRLEEPDEVHAKLQLAVGRSILPSAVFHEVERDLVLPAGAW